MKIIKRVLLFTGTFFLGIVLLLGGRQLAELDPFSKFTRDYVNPLGEGIGSVMNDVRVEVFEKGEPVLSFATNRVEVRRDQQMFRMFEIHDGKIIEEGVDVAQFGAGFAVYEAQPGLVRASGNPWISSKDGKLSSPAVLIDNTEKTVTVKQGVSGDYQEGKLNASSFIWNYGEKTAVVEQFLWSGPIEYQDAGQTRRRLVQIRGDRFETLTNPDRVIYYNAEAVDDDALIRARKITHERENDIIIAEGECEYHGPDAIIYAPSVTVYNKEKRAIATGKVQIVIKPEKEKGKVPQEIKPADPQLPTGLQRNQEKLTREQEKAIEEEVRGGKSLRKYPIVVRAEKVEYFYRKGNKRAVMTGNPVARQELSLGAWREMSGPIAIYEEEKELLTIQGTKGKLEVNMTNSLGDAFKAEMLIISTVEGDEKITGIAIEGSLRIREDDEEEPPVRSAGGGGGGG